MYGLSTTTVFPLIRRTDNEDSWGNPRTQNHTRPEIDEAMCHTLEGNELKEALNFIDNIRASKMKIEWSSINVWAVYRGFRHVMDIKVANNTWNITLLLDHATSGASHFGSEREGVRKLINSLKNSVSTQKEATQYAS